MRSLVVATFLGLSATSFVTSVVPEERVIAEEEPANANELTIHADAAWRTVIFNGQPLKTLKVSLVAQGGPADQASACGNLKIDSIRDGNDQPVRSDEITHLAGMLLVGQENRAASPKNGVQLSFDLHHPPALKSIGELRGSFALQTGGSTQEVIVDEVLKQAGGAISDARLRDLGISIRLARSTQKSASRESEKPQNVFTPGEAEDGQEILVFDVTTHTTPVTRLHVTTHDGKPHEAISLEFDSSIRKAKFAADKFADDSHLRLTVHRDAKEITVPFVVRDIEVRTQRGPGRSGGFQSVPK